MAPMATTGESVRAARFSRDVEVELAATGALERAELTALEAAAISEALAVPMPWQSSRAFWAKTVAKIASVVPSQKINLVLVLLWCLCYLR